MRGGCKNSGDLKGGVTGELHRSDPLHARPTVFAKQNFTGRVRPPAGGRGLALSKAERSYVSIYARPEFRTDSDVIDTRSYCQRKTVSKTPAVTVRSSPTINLDNGLARLGVIGSCALGAGP